MLYKPIKAFYILITLVSSFLIFSFVEVGKFNLSASACSETKLTQYPENLLKTIQTLQAPISLYEVYDYSLFRCGNHGVISVYFVDAQGTEFMFGVTPEDKLFFNTPTPSEQGTVRLATGDQEAKTILLNLIKDWLQNHPPSQQAQQPQQRYSLKQRYELDEENADRKLEDEYRRILLLIIERLEK